MPKLKAPLSKSVDKKPGLRVQSIAGKNAKPKGKSMGTSGTTTPPSSGGSKSAAPAQPKNTYSVYLRPGVAPGPGGAATTLVTVQGDSVEAKNIGTSLYWSISGASGADFEWDVVSYITYVPNPPAA